MKKRYRNTKTGDVGHMVERGGSKYVKYTRGRHSPLAPYDERFWEPYEEERREFNPAQRGIVAFKADRALCRVMGNFAEANIMWESLPHDKQVEWNDPDKPPVEGDERRWLYMMVHRAMMPKAKPKELANG